MCNMMVRCYNLYVLARRRRARWRRTWRVVFVFVLFGGLCARRAFVSCVRVSIQCALCANRPFAPPLFRGAPTAGSRGGQESPRSAPTHQPGA